jgi:hypothetical protein
MNDKQLTRVLERLAEGLVPGDLDLWPTAQVLLEKNNRLSQIGDPSMNMHIARNRRLRLVSFLLLALLAVTALFFVTPLGQALGQQILHFFNRASADQLPRSYLSTPYPTQDPNDSNQGPYYELHETVQEVQKQAGFHVLEPTYLPETLSLTGASFDPKLHIVRIFYGYIPLYTNGLLLREEPYQRNDNCELCGVVGASAPVETVQIGDATGEYVEGAWHLTDNGPVWEPDPYLKTLRWKVDGMAFEIQYMGPYDSMSKEGLIAIAASLK